MSVTCVCNIGFEDQLEPGKEYKILSTGVNGYLIAAGDGVERWYGFAKFEFWR